MSEVFAVLAALNIMCLGLLAYGVYTLMRDIRVAKEEIRNLYETTNGVASKISDIRASKARRKGPCL